VEATPPLAGFNPFSPTKKDRNRYDQPDQRPNPFATPTSHLKRPTSTNASPDNPFLSVEPKGTSHAPNAAVARARKRLRGEPISPSPCKDKRQRLSLPFPFANHDKPPSSEEGDDGEEEGEDDVLDNSPVKPPPVAGPAGKVFKLLFNEVSPLPTQKGKGKEKELKDKDAVPFTKSTFRTELKRSTSLFTTSNDSQASFKTSIFTPSSRPAARTHAGMQKRVFSETDMARDPNQSLYSSQVPNSPPVVQLLRPSPPPVAPSASANASSSKHNAEKRRQGATTSRKKAKLKETNRPDDGDHGQSSSENDTETDKIRVIDPFRSPPKAVEPSTSEGTDKSDDIDDEDHILSRRSQVRSAEYERPDLEDAGKVSVDLPDDLRRVLSLNPSSSGSPKYMASKEKRLLESVLRGSARARYEGEVWSVGEAGRDEVLEEDRDGEEEWEGEGIPWEVAEL
jgi:hypothetical protein